MHLNASHFDRQHIYRVEWEPPNDDESGGYIKWFCDDELVYGIQSNVLNLTGAHIPDEPMYIILNTAVSSSWGFPKPCPNGCDCSCFQCGNPDCECGLPDGFCKNIPASFEIDFVRVYQSEGEKKHTLGCSTPKRPTKSFIEGHKERYMSKGERAPLKPIRNGGGKCSSNYNCGGIERGICKNNHCICHQDFGGSFCLADSVSYDFGDPTLKFHGKNIIKSRNKFV